MGRQEFHTADLLRLEVQEGWPALPNLVPNPSGDVGAWDWTVPAPGTLESVPTGLQVSAPANPVDVPIALTAAVGLPAGTGRYVNAWARLVEIVGLDFVDITVWFGPGTDSPVGTQLVVGSLTELVAPVPVPDSATHVYLAVRPTYVSLSQAARFVFREAGLAVGTLAEVQASEPLAEPPWVDVLGQTHQITVERDELNLSTLTATIYDSELDPAAGDLIRPGKRCRLQAWVAGVWENLLVGTLDKANVTYNLRDPKTPDRKRARIELTANDNATVLAQAPRPDGVATIDDLRAVLLGAGVPWNVNGSTDAINPDDVAIVAVNANASALDQVAITRDSVLGYAWLDRDGVLQAWDRDQVPATAALGIDESDYTGIDIDFDTERCINTVKVKHVRINPGTGETEEVDLGPYVDPVSVREWRQRGAEFRVQGVLEEDIPAYAAEILAANATPRIRVNGLTMPLRTPQDVAVKALLDLYDLVTVTNERAAIFAEPSRITTIKHAITTSRWTIEVGFTTDGSVAMPQVTPAPVPSGGRTLSQLLRPVGELTDVYGTPAMIARDWPGWLICDGSAYDVGQYPRLHAWLTEMVTAGVHSDATLLPNYVDRFRIGAGAKAVGSAGGSSTVTLRAENLPRSDGTGTSENRVPRGSAANPASPLPVDVMPPWRAAYTIIRAA